MAFLQSNALILSLCETLNSAFLGGLGILRQAPSWCYFSQPLCIALWLIANSKRAIIITSIGINTALAPISSKLFITTKL